MTTYKRASFFVAAAAAVSACGDITVPNYADPELKAIVESPTPDLIRSAATGIVHGSRNGANGYVLYTSILGREGYFLDPNEDRYVRRTFAGGPRATDVSGSGYWTAPYRTIQLGSLVSHALDKVEMPAAEESSIRGFARTMQAFELLQILQTREKIPVETDTPLDGITTPAPIVERAAAYTYIAKLLDDGLTDLNAGGTSSFTFATSPGIAARGFGNAAGFAKFNRAVKARLEVYRASEGGGAANYTAALTALNGSFITTPATASLETLNLGPQHFYSSAAGDVANGMYDPSGKTVADSMLVTRATAGDQRVARKIGPTPAVRPPVRGLSSHLAFTIYPTLSSPIPMIRNEELILLRAEAKYFTGDKPGALADLNYVRTNSGGLPGLQASAIDTDAKFVTALLYERRYSLMFEGGHSWIDFRRFNRLTDLKALGTIRTDGAADVVAKWLPIPQAETDARS